MLGLGNRSSTVAGALSRAALASLDRASEATPLPALALHRHDAPALVAALLAAPQRRSRPVWALIATALGAGLALAWATHESERFFVISRVGSHR